MSRLDEQIRRQAEALVAGRSAQQKADAASVERARNQNGRYPPGTLAGDASAAAVQGRRRNSRDSGGAPVSGGRDTGEIDVGWLVTFMRQRKIDRLTTSRFRIAPGAGSPYKFYGPEGWPNGKYYGRIKNNLLRFNADAVRADLPHILRIMADDPINFLAADAIEAERCCFCGRSLDDPESRLRGWGPVCARKHGLPHGNRHGF